jgi:hypothetical protein
VVGVEEGVVGREEVGVEEGEMEGLEDGVVPFLGVDDFFGFGVWAFPFLDGCFLAFFAFFSLM